MSTRDMLLAAVALADAVDKFAALDPQANLVAAVEHMVSATTEDLLRSLTAVLTSSALLTLHRDVRA